MCEFPILFARGFLAKQSDQTSISFLQFFWIVVPWNSTLSRFYVSASFPFFANFLPTGPTNRCFRVLMTVHCISANFYIGENDFLLRGDTCHGLTSTRVSWPLGVTRNRSRAQRSYPIPVQRQHLSRDMDVLRANQEWLSFFSPRIATSKLRPIRSCGDNDRMYAILPIIRFAIDSIPIEGEILVIDEILRMEVEFSKG